ncbi:hypothetical protein [Sphaerotilus sp.]|uniref:hypothetical protein n=1 Tax=Sphaerotilus sp. TaxID=2093942 RepID=UPI002ACD58B3|nr:hypothetical protein [Sphaerotilus sp.]MDZ7857364.1 hypothetical protein [Sphaerotilus sp.]
MTARRALLTASGAVVLGGCLHPLSGLSGARHPARDPAQWPFASDSPWNTALGDGARFAPIRSPRFDPGRGATVNTLQWSHPVFIAQADDPTVLVYRRGQAEPVHRVRVPRQARPDPMADGALHLIDATRRTVTELWKAERVGPDRIVATVVVVNSLTGAGVYPSWHGARAYGGSALGGLIRSGELEHGIPHALAIAVQPQALNRVGPDGRAWVWPASSADDGDGRRYGIQGNLHMGSLLALPPELDLRSLGLHPGPETSLARALQDFGACITDCAAGNLVFYGELQTHTAASSLRASALQAMTAHLQVVTNHTPATVGGGGIRRAPPAPMFAPVHD